jgi:predicted neuraminidase
MGWGGVCSIVALLLSTGFAGGQAQTGFIFAPLMGGHALAGTQPDNHASTLVELRNGDVLAAWFAGTWEGAADVAIYAARQHDGVWSAPRELARAEKVACWNPVLFHDGKGVLWLYYKVGGSPSTWTGMRKRSSDEGVTWSAAEKLPEGVLGPIKDKPLVLADGAIVSGSSVENDKWTAWIERSADDGKSWTKAGPITVPDALDVPDAGALEAVREGQHTDYDKAAGVETKVYPPSATTVGLIQPAVVSLGGGHLRFYARSKTRAARIAVADSMDEGRTWTQAHYVDLPNPNSGIDAVGLRDGRVVLIFNNSYNRRSPLNLAVSRDGEHFTVFKKLDEGPGQYSYPAIVQAANGDLLMTYSWRRQTIKFVRVPLGELPPAVGPTASAPAVRPTASRGSDSRAPKSEAHGAVAEGPMASRGLENLPAGFAGGR